MSVITAEQALVEALTEEMRRDPRVLTFGEGVGTKLHELAREFGAARVRNTPLAEGIIAGTAAGAAAMGLRPVIDLLFAPFLAVFVPAGRAGAHRCRLGRRRPAQSQPGSLVRPRAGAQGRDALDAR
jgi:pyruvate/2-oxoglutarate/acetoin dehydrogenase E1 component